MAVDPKAYTDSREVPRYTIGEAAFFLDIPPSTVRWWCLGRRFKYRGEERSSLPLIKPALYDPRNPSLCFYNLAELHTLAATRKFNRISMQKVRDAIDYLTAAYPSSHPLLGHDFFTDGKDLFIKRLSETVNLSRKGQLAFKEIVDTYLDRLVPDSNGLPEAIYPIRHKDASKKPVVISYGVGGGQPITPKKGIRVSVLVNRNRAGESYKQLADDYGLTDIEVEEAIRYMEAA